MTTDARRQLALSQAIREGRFTDDCPSGMFVDVDSVRQNVHNLFDAGYPQNTLHTVAVKANPVGKVLDIFRGLGMGAEVASFGELQQALHIGFPPSTVVFDSPAKTMQELQFALSNSINMNLDNFQELDRVVSLMKDMRTPQPDCMIGLRINPQVGAGDIAALSTAVAHSKFGIPLLEQRHDILAAFAAHRWLNALHLHVGSQGCPLELIVEGVARVWELLQEINAAASGVEGQVVALDIGGGLPVDYGSDAGGDGEGPTHQQLAELLRARVPQLFQPDCRVRLVTEYGRSLLAKCSFTASRVEYNKTAGGRRMAVVHVGADLFVRAAYQPATWPLRALVHDATGRSKMAAGDGLEPPQEWAVQDVVGPLCFQGDRLAEQRHLPLMVPGDFVVIPDTGAYTLSMYSHYNSRCAPPVWGFRMNEDGATIRLEVLRSGDSVEGILRFWNQQ